jgi:DNA helicase-2/ATP-dependent DNA helicase PcrA
MSTTALREPAAFGAGLNDAQRRAATHGEPAAPGVREGPHTGQHTGHHTGQRTGVHSGPLLVIAGAGTGKTNTLAHRVAHLLLSGVSPERIALLTFSRRAAQEMLQRAERICRETQEAHAKVAAAEGRRARTTIHPNATRMLWSGTFHAIGNRLLREYAATLGLEPGFSVIDRGDAADLLDIERQKLGFAKLHKRFPRKDTCLALYSHRVNTRGTLVDTIAQLQPWCDEWRDELMQLFRAYVAAKQAQQVLDYDDLLLYWHVLVQEPALAREIGGRFDHVLVDEYQDTNTLQAEILLALKPDGAGLCVVGDDAQAIYSFRAATVDNILGFPAHFTPPATVVTLDENYRSVQPILDAANALMREGTRRFDKQLHSPRASAQKPRYITVEDDRAQADYVVAQVLEKREQGTLLKKQAVLMRSSHHSDLLELELVRRNIPYVKYGGLKFLEAAHVKDVLALLRFVDNPRNRLAGFRTLQLLPGIGPGIADRALAALEHAGHTLQALAEFRPPAAAREDWDSLVALLRDLHAAPEWNGQMERVRAWYAPHLQRLYEAAHVREGEIEQLQRLAAQHPSRERFITELTLDPPQASGDQAGPPLVDEDYLVLSTVHSAKGQEWNSVYVLNVSDGSFPNEFAAGKPELVEEERRLLYVAITRAKDDLQLIAPLKYYVTQQRRFGERHVYGARSRFLTEDVLGTFEAGTWPPQVEGAPTSPASTTVRIDAAARMRGMWDE